MFGPIRLNYSKRKTNYVTIFVCCIEFSTIWHMLQKHLIEKILCLVILYYCSIVCTSMLKLFIVSGSFLYKDPAVLHRRGHPAPVLLPLLLRLDARHVPRHLQVVLRGGWDGKGHTRRINTEEKADVVAAV